MIGHLSELQQKDPIYWIVQKKLANPNINLYLSKFGKS